MPDDAVQSDKTIITEPPADMMPAAEAPAPALVDPPPAAPASSPPLDTPPSEQSGKGALDGKRMSLLEHLSELRSRLRNAAIALLLAMIGSFILVERYFDWLTRPVRKGMRAALPKEAGDSLNFYAKSLTEPFWVYMKLAIIGGSHRRRPLRVLGALEVRGAGPLPEGEAACRTDYRGHRGLFCRGRRVRLLRVVRAGRLLSDQAAHQLPG